MTEKLMVSLWLISLALSLEQFVINHCDVSDTVILIQIEDLKWELEQKQREIDAQKQQQELVEQCHLMELDNLQRALQVFNSRVCVFSPIPNWEV